MRVHVIGGFLGAGKTTAMRALARHLEQRGDRVALVTNDQGHALVDTALCRTDASPVQEIGGGCFCCRYTDLDEALRAAEAAGATTTIAEAVGSCTDLVATVIAPLADLQVGRFDVAPLTVVVDPRRVEEMARDGFDDDVRYLFRKQIEEADVVVLSRADLDPPDVREVVRGWNPGAAIVAVSGRTGTGIEAWVAAAPATPAEPLAIDYDRYAAAEAALGWCNARVRLRAVREGGVLDAAPILARFFDALRDAPVAHLKVTSPDGLGGSAALTCRGGEAVFVDAASMARGVGEIVWLVNARVALSPEALEARLRAAMEGAALDAVAVWEELACFRPGRPVPLHRYATRCCAEGERVGDGRLVGSLVRR